MSACRVGVVMNGVTGRMGYNQHLVRSILAIREHGGVTTSDGAVILPEPILVGRSAVKLRRIAEQHGLEHWTTDLSEALARKDVLVYFDTQATSAREKAIREAIAAGKHVYTEKPLAGDLTSAFDLVRLAADAGIRTGVVQDKLFLPGRGSSPGWWKAGSSGGCCQYGASSDTGCSKAIARRPSGLHGISARKRAAA